MLKRHVSIFPYFPFRFVSFRFPSCSFCQFHQLLLVDSSFSENRDKAIF